MRRGDCAEVACPKNGDVWTPENAPRFAWFRRLNACAYSSRRYFFVEAPGNEGAEAPSPPPTRIILTCGPPVCCCSGPKFVPQLKREPISQREAPRALLRSTAKGRSLMTVSPLSSNPVVML